MAKPKSKQSKSPRLSKSRFMAGLQCPKRLYLEAFNRELMTPPGPSQQRIFDSGNFVGELARKEFPGGVLIDPPFYETEQALKETNEAIASGAQVIFEPAFLYKNVFVRVDVLRKTERGAWDLIEVKSTLSASDTHILDLAIQKFVVQGAGLNIESCYLMHLNRDCRYSDLSNLFIIEPVNERVEAIKQTIEPQVDIFNDLLKQDKVPYLPVGRQCTKPYECPFIDHCFKDIKKPSIFTIPRISSTKIDSLIRTGITSLLDIPDDFALSDNQRQYVSLFKSGKPNILWSAIEKELEALEYPLYFLDFETQSDAVPRLEGLGCYRQYPFQYSLHILFEDSNLIHTEYLHPDKTDPRRSLAESLISDIGSAGTIIAYNASFEKWILRDMSWLFPEHRNKLHNMLDRFFDLLLIFRSFYFDPGFGGSNSIKKVLPVLIPEMSYKTLDVQSGDMAQLAWLQMINTEDPSQRDELEKSLKAYCKLDTLSMLEIYHFLQRELQKRT